VRALHATEAALRDLGDVVERSGVQVHVADTQQLTLLAASPDHQGVVAEVAPYEYADAGKLLATPDALVLALDQVSDPHNLGAIARVCDAAGATGILIPEHRSASVTGAVCKASAGAVEHVRIARCTNLADTLERAKDARLWVYGASERGRRRYTQIDCTGPVVLVLGSEGKGIRPRVESVCDELAAVPMAGQVSSLNVATVAALLAFEAVRQRADAQ
jgi:23S rRNA (guanosine2251-2'-O)-methyltransferase